VWWIATHLEDLSAEKVERRAATVLEVRVLAAER
jgi:hypothetical protein